ncbi:nucleotidyltransferase family protein [Dyella sedimenti]|uniref:nucleotidyltransferase family protein n=1 Tax=Dyella sedimenti TaxID=2919947 RepID=UPI001FAB2964|nr:nucleotidyltransferase family protein [Dyella sedimenti]
MNAPQVGIVLLAAGEGRRYGGIKQLARIEGEPMVRRAARTLLATGMPVLAVTGAHAAPVEAELGDLPLRIEHHAAWREGMGGSLAAGVRALLAWQPSASGILACLADQPGLRAWMLQRLLARHAQAPTRVLAARHGDAAGPPALFPRDCFDALRACAGDRGARDLFKAEASRVETFDFGELVDVDTPADLGRAMRSGCQADPAQEL